MPGARCKTPQARPGSKRTRQASKELALSHPRMLCLVCRRAPQQLRSMQATQASLAACVAAWTSQHTGTQ